MLAEELQRIDREIARWEKRLAAGGPADLAATLQGATSAAHGLLRAYLAAAGRPVPGPDAKLLEAFRMLARGDPRWNAIRDNLRELVYYANCLAADRRDALPASPERMAVRTARHLYLYVRSRCETEGRL